MSSSRPQATVAVLASVISPAVLGVLSSDPTPVLPAAALSLNEGDFIQGKSDPVTATLSFQGFPSLSGPNRNYLARQTNLCSSLSPCIPDFSSSNCFPHAPQPGFLRAALPGMPPGLSWVLTPPRMLVKSAQKNQVFLAFPSSPQCC